MVGTTQNSTISINKGTTIAMDVHWPANDTINGTITDWVFSIFDADLVPGMSGLTVTLVDDVNLILSLDMPGVSCALLPPLSAFRIQAILPTGDAHTTNRIQIEIT